jgi:hypothetical protein
MHSSYSGPQTASQADEAGLDSTFNATRESNGSTTQKEKKKKGGIFSVFGFKKKTKE